MFLLVSILSVPGAREVCRWREETDAADCKPFQKEFRPALPCPRSQGLCRTRFLYTDGQCRSKRGCFTGNHFSSMAACKTACDSQPKCGRHEEFRECGSACPAKCGEEEPKFCSRKCVSGCFCRPGTVRSSTGKCITLRKCSKGRHDDEGSDEDESVTTTCPDNSEFNNCPSPCPARCGDTGTRLCASVCLQPACQCRAGYLLSPTADACVSSSECLALLRQPPIGRLPPVPFGRANWGNRDPCAGNPCPYNMDCTPEPKNCFTTPCPQYVCKPQNPCEPNPCPASSVCTPEPKQCFTTPCPQYACSAPNPCSSNPCPRNQRCIHEPKACFSFARNCPQHKCIRSCNRAGFMRDPCINMRCRISGAVCQSNAACTGFMFTLNDQDVTDRCFLG